MFTKMSSAGGMVGIAFTKIVCVAIHNHLRDPNVDSYLAFTTSKIILAGIVLGLGVSVYKFNDWIGGHAADDPYDPDEAAMNARAFGIMNQAYVRGRN